MLSVPIRTVPVALASRAALVRAYTSSAKEGSVAQSREFGKRERAQEEEYARRHDAELLRRLRVQVEEKKKELAELESKVKDAEPK